MWVGGGAAQVVHLVASSGAELAGRCAVAVAVQVCARVAYELWHFDLWLLGSVR